MLPAQHYDTLLDLRRRANATLSCPGEGTKVANAASSPLIPQPTTTFVLINGILIGIQSVHRVTNGDNHGNSGSMIDKSGSIATAVASAKEATVHNRNEAIGVDDGLFEPLPLKEDIFTDDESSVRSKKRHFHETPKVKNLSSYKACLNDPFLPRPIMETESDGLTFVDETTIENYRQSMSFSGSDTEDDDDDDDNEAADRYLEIAEMLRAEHDDQSSQPSKRPRILPQHELSDVEEMRTISSSGFVCPPTPPPSPDLSSLNNNGDGTTSQPKPVDSNGNEMSSGMPVSTHTQSNKHEECTEKHMDASSIMSRLDELMFKSEVTQTALQYFDKRRGLPKSHCQTMVNSSRSRKQLLEGKIIKKWNGRPLLGEDGDTISIASEAGPRRRRRKHSQASQKAWTPQNDVLTEEVFSDNVGAVEKREKPRRRMSAPL